MRSTLSEKSAEPGVADAKCVTIHYFAALREQIGRQIETRETSAMDAAALYAELQAQTAIRLSASLIKVAINGEFVTWDQPINDGDHVVFIPPVSGG